MSSRNVYLSNDERAQALTLRESLLLAQRRVTAGIRDASALRDEIVGLVARQALLRLDYVEFVHGETLDPVDTLSGQVLLALAAFVGRTRLIDNATLQVDE